MADASKKVAKNLGELLEGLPKNWGKWGPDDELGSLNYLTPEQVLKGVATIKSGKTFTLQIQIGNPKGDPILSQLAHAAALAAREGASASGYVEQLLKALQQRLVDFHFCPETASKEKHGPGLSGAARLRVEALVRERLMGPVTARELADIARLSLGHFNRAFRQTFGTSPHQYVINQRITHASSLLEDTDLAISEVARLSGFTSCSYFGAQFRRATGMSPGEYRRRA